jgi:hypothetical protein
MSNRGQGLCLEVAGLLRSIGAAALLLFASAANAQDIEPPKGSASQKASDPETEESRDTRLEKQVETKFEKDAVLKAQGLDVTVVGGKVTLTGTTASEKDKSFAQKTAQSVKGVSEVDNQILVRGSKEAAKPAGDRGKRKATTKPEETRSTTTPPRAPERPVPTEDVPTETDRAVPKSNVDREAPRQTPPREPNMPEPRAPDTDIAPVIPEERWPQDPARKPEPGTSEEGKTPPPGTEAQIEGRTKLP